MGTVYVAWHGLLQRKTALKLVKRSELSAKTEALFAHEARLTSELSHPNTVALYDYGQTPDGIFYYAMEFVDGITLKDLVRIEGPLPAGRVLFLLRQVTSSLAQAHARGLVHRDIKPSNVMVCYREGHPDCVKVLDFGLAIRLGDEAQAEGEDQEVAGTPEFMAPETAWNHEVGPASDVYGVGVLGYFLLTAMLPYSGTGSGTIPRLDRAAPLLPPSLRTTHEVPSDLERVLLACLERDPRRRCPDAGALLDALEACGEGRSWSRQQARAWWTKWERGGRSAHRSTGESRSTTITHPETKPLPLVARKVSFGG